MRTGLRRIAWVSVARCGSVVGALSVLYALVPLRGDRWWVGAVVGICALAVSTPIAIARSRAVRSSDRPIADAIEALVLLVTLTIYGFSALYLAIDRNRTQFAGLETRADGVYFTVSTLSTVGFGDITAVGQEARIAVVMQILFDLTLLGVGVRVLSTAARRRFVERGNDPHRVMPGVSAGSWVESNPSDEPPLREEPGMAQPDVHGPIDFLLLEFDGDKMTGTAADALMDLVDAGIIRIYDLLVIRKDHDGSVEGIDIRGLSKDEVGSFTLFAGARSGLLNDDDVAQAGEALAPGDAAALIVYENSWAIPFVAAARQAGAQVVASARIPADVIIEVLDERELADAPT